jgi:hypothetical protein
VLVALRHLVSDCRQEIRNQRFLVQKERFLPDLQGEKFLQRFINQPAIPFHAAGTPKTYRVIDTGKGVAI